MSVIQNKSKLLPRVALFMTLLGVVMGFSMVLLPAASVSAAPDYNGQCKAASIDETNCAPVAYVLLLINILSALVGIIVVIMIAYGGVQYTMAKDNPQQITEARNKIRNAVLAFVVYLFVFSFLQWLVPGGIF